MPCLTGGLQFMQQMYCKFVYIKFSQMQRLGFAAKKIKKINKSSVCAVLMDQK